MSHVKAEDALTMHAYQLIKSVNNKTIKFDLHITVYILISLIYTNVLIFSLKIAACNETNTYELSPVSPVRPFSWYHNILI